MVLHTLQALLQKIAEGHAVADFGLLATALYYLDDFPERCHHPKEDEYLFRRLRLCSTEFDGLLDRLQAEHVRSAAAVSGLHRALVHYQGGALEGLRLFRAAVDSYAAAMRGHMTSEDALLARAAAVLRESDWVRIARAFADNDDPLFGSSHRVEFSQLYQRIVMLVPRKMKTGLRASDRPPLRPR
jgi:hemerythrin-like domain-containing protein